MDCRGAADRGQYGGGTLSVTGVQDDGSVAPKLGQLAELIRPLEQELADVLEQHAMEQESANVAVPSKSDDEPDTSPDVSTDPEPSTA